MIRRLEIACSMLISPRMMFLDEPTIGLDPSARKIVWEHLIKYKKENGATIFFNTHYMDEADMYADEIAIINRGVIVAEGTPGKLKHSVGGEMVTLNVEGKPKLGLFRGMKAVKNAFLTGSTLNLIVDDAESFIPAVIKFAKENRVTVRKAAISKPTLDDVFLKYAGSRIEDTERLADIKGARHAIRRMGK